LPEKLCRRFHQHAFDTLNEALLYTHAIAFDLFTCSYAFPAKSHIIAQFESVNCLFALQFVVSAQIQVHVQVLVARSLGRLVYTVSFVFHNQHQYVASPDTPLDINQFHTDFPDQFSFCCSIFLAIAIHSLFVIK
jgi:hypothetical protein